jgi:hypothetical protein
MSPEHPIWPEDCATIRHERNISQGTGNHPIAEKSASQTGREFGIRLPQALLIDLVIRYLEKLKIPLAHEGGPARVPSRF